MTTFNIPTMHCEGCVKKITKALKHHKVKGFNIDLPNKQLTVDLTNQDFKPSDIQDITKEAGYEAEING